MGWYESWFGTRYYASLYGHRDEMDAKAWVDLIQDRWNLEPGQRLLDLACGRGRHAKWFTVAGSDVTGVDISEESIAEATRNIPEANFRVQDMRDPLGHGEFDAACCLFTSLGYFRTLQDNESVFRAVFEALRPGGRFVLDFMNSQVVLRDLVAHETIVRDAVRFTIDRRLENDILVKTIQVEDKGCISHFEERVQTLRTEDLVAMANNVGFLIEDRTDGPDPRPFDPNDSERFVLWMKKPIT